MRSITIAFTSSLSSDTIGDMGRASFVLKRVLEGSVFRWFHDTRDPTAETVVEIVKALKKINPAAAEEFVKLYLVDVLVEDEE